MSRSSGFFSIDASLALFIAALSFALFSALAAAAAASASSSARGEAGALLALRFSSYVLEQSAPAGFPSQPGAHYSANELDLGRLGAIDIGKLQAESGKGYASIRVEGSSGQLFFAESGRQGAERFCAARLALLSGEIVRLEACIS